MECFAPFGSAGIRREAENSSFFFFHINKTYFLQGLFFKNSFRVQLFKWKKKEKRFKIFSTFKEKIKLPGRPFNVKVFVALQGFNSEAITLNDSYTLKRTRADCTL